MDLDRPSVTVTTDGSGDATAYLGDALVDGSMGPTTGRVLSIIYEKTDFATGVDFTITTDVTGQNVWVETNVDASKTVNPSVETHDTSGVAASSRDYVMLADERLKIVVANGGSTKTGKFTLVFEKA